MALFRSKFIAIGLLAVIGLAACGDDGGGYGDASTPADDDGGGYDYSASSIGTTTTAATDTSVDDSDTTVPEVVISARDVQLADSSFGQIVVDGDGNTLYLFTSDSAGTVTCTGGCASAWPGLAPHGAELVIDGPDDSLFSIVLGAGGPQVAFNGHPLYHFSGDSAPGDTNGQGSGGVWFVVDADGNAITG